MKFLERILHPEGFEREIEFYRLPKRYQSRFYNFKYPHWFQWIAFLCGRTALTPLTREAERSLSKLLIGKRNPPRRFLENPPTASYAELKPMDGEERSRSVEEMKVFINVYAGRLNRRQKWIFLRAMKRHNKETYGE